MCPATFLGIDPADQPPADACRYAILPLAYDGTASYGKGTIRGPEAIIEASTQVEFWDEELGFVPSKAGITTLAGPKLEGLSPEAMVAAAEAAARVAVCEGRQLIGLGGEHSVTFGLLRAVHAAVGDFDVLQIDAHSDLRDSYEGSPHSHASIMARALELGCRIVQVGIRACGEEEQDALARPEVTTFWMHEIRRRPLDEWISEAVAALGPRVFVTFDLDAFDPSMMPSTGTPEPGGLDWASATAVLRAVAREREIVGSDFVELAPVKGVHAPDFLSARLVYRWIGYLEAARTGRL
jgi:agmatinase